MRSSLPRRGKPHAVCAPPSSQAIPLARILCRRRPSTPGLKTQGVARCAGTHPWRITGGTAAAQPVLLLCAPRSPSLRPSMAPRWVRMTLPLWCDVTVAAAGAKVGFVFGKRGLTMECLSSYFLERCVGHKVAMELVLTGRASERRMLPRLVQLRCAGDRVLPPALELAREMCDASPMSCMINRHMIIRHGHNTSPEEAHLLESRAIKWVSSERDAREGIQSFLDKRPPNFPMDPFADSPDWFPWWRQIETKSRL